MQPLKHIQPLTPAGSFAAVRKHDIHTGIDLYCSPGTEVYAVEAGKVALIGPFTGVSGNCPWWNDTWCVGVLGLSGFIVYGEIEPSVELGMEITEGQLIGKVLQVLKKDKGLPMSMLHLELYTRVMEPAVWELDKPIPEGLLDPTLLVFNG